MKSYKEKYILKISIFFLLQFLIPPFLLSENNDAIMKEDNCIKCHIEIDLLPESFTSDDIHIQAGLSCSGCHGGDPKSENEEEAMSKENNFVGVPEKKDIPNFCGKCHSDITFMRQYRPRIQTDQVNQYYTSTHGKKLLDGDQNVADCVSCHTSHSIFKLTDARSTVYPLNIPETCNHCHGKSGLMIQYGLKSDQYNKYITSVHGKALLEKHDLGAPACNDCYGNHGAVPPQVESISHVCGTCHLNNMNFFQNSILSEKFSEKDIHACEACHGYHDISHTSDKMLGGGSESICATCHGESDTGFKIGKVIKNNLDTLANSYQRAETFLTEVTIKGMNDLEISYELTKAKQQLIQSRTSIHSFDTLVVSSFVKDGLIYTTKAEQLAELEMDEYYRRRSGFLYSSIILFVLGLGIFLKIRYKNN